MAFNPLPKRLADEVNERLTFSSRQMIDEHTLKRYQFSLKRRYEEGKFDAYDYVALGKIYFNLRRYQDFLDLLEEALGRMNDLEVLAPYIMGKMMIADQQWLPLRSFDAMKEWFDPERNPSKEPLSFRFSHERWAYQDEEYRFEKVASGDVVLQSDGVFRIRMGPLLVMETYAHFRQEHCDFLNHAFDSFLDRVVLESTTEEELDYFRDILGSANFDDLIKRVLKAAMKQGKLIATIPGLDYRLKKGIPVIVTVEGGYVVASNSDLDIVLSGETVQGALEEFMEFFRVDSRQLIEAPDESLSEDAKSLKSRYLEYIEA